MTRFVLGLVVGALLAAGIAYGEDALESLKRLGREQERRTERMLERQQDRIERMSDC